MNNGNLRLQPLIRWTRSDYAKLSYAVRQFNKRVSELESLEENFAPSEFDYKELRDSIYSRKELNRVIKSLKRINRESQQRIVTTPQGEKLTQWEFSELKKAQKRAIARINYKTMNFGEIEIDVMGDREFKSLTRTKESIEDLFNRTGYDFSLTKQRTLSWGKNDYDLWRADIFRNNFMNALEEMSIYKNYDLLVDKLKSIKNPIQFYNYVRQSNILSDLFLFYKDKATSQTYGGFVDNQEAFNTAIFNELKLMNEEIHS